mmetsp:Transcript_24286/g.37107  ORF Transcript_24286/g.37107 Transcript_24286/m.37107 type:complete len:1157 (-) Transcript_24286:40-3510(-)
MKIAFDDDSYASNSDSESESNSEVSESYDSDSESEAYDSEESNQKSRRAKTKTKATGKANAKAKSKAKSNRRKSVLLLSEDEEEDYDTAVGNHNNAHTNNNNKNKGKLCFDDDDDDDNEDDDGYLSPLEHEHEHEHDKENIVNKRKTHPDPNSNSAKKQPQPQPLAAKNNSNSNSKSSNKRTPNPKPKKKRRRSSARFLRLSKSNRHTRTSTSSYNDNDMDDDDMYDEEEEEQVIDNTQLTSMYQRAIQMHAANKINVNNTWNLNLIDNIDKFLGDDDDVDDDDVEVDDDVDDDDVDAVKAGKNTSGKTNEKTKTRTKRVNFTKASCTLDASVKIYSYRVDDVHLTSYKVLANLNRTTTETGTDNNNKQKNNRNGSGNEDVFGDDIMQGDEDGMGIGIGMEEHVQRRRRRQSAAAVKTIETNTAALNISKIDSAYDIDPIFHKMSQKFDEGGAKGLLLVNLGVANDGCRIVLDSKDNHENADATSEDHGNEDGNDGNEDTSNEPALVSEGMMDISHLVDKLRDTLQSQPGPSISAAANLENVKLVPQLEDLRTDYALLEEEGFVDAAAKMKPKSLRYANNAEEEKAAEEVIHREALERSTASGLGLNRTSFKLGTSIISSSIASASSPRYGKDDDNNANNDAHDFEADDFDDGYDDVDAGGGFDLHDDTDAQPAASAPEGCVDGFLAMDNMADKYSSDSFQNDFTLLDDHEDSNGNPEHSHARSSGSGGGRGLNVTFLDEICAGDAFAQNGAAGGYNNKYNYFNPAALDKLTSGNQWAGSAHWKKKNNHATPHKGRRGADNVTMGNGEPAATSTANNTKRKDSKRGRTKKEATQRSYVDFAACDECLQTLLKSSKKKVSRGRGKTKSKEGGDAQQMTKIMRLKHGKDHNVLPRDAGIDVKQFTKFFMRPDANLANGSTSLVGSRKEPVRKSVGFLGLDTEQFHDDGMQNNDFYDDDHDHGDGPGFELHDDGGINSHDSTDNNTADDYIIKELEGVRKVDKVRVSHATVAKKVDVRRLKRDLWNELEVSTTAKAPMPSLGTANTATAVAGEAESLPVNDGEKDTDGNEFQNDNQDMNMHLEPAAIAIAQEDSSTELVSFKDTIHKLGATEAQEDVSLAFYFICVLHLANEKGLKLENGEHGLNDFVISRDGEVGSLQ